MKKILLATTAAMAISATTVFAQSATDQLVSIFQSQGYERIEIKNGLTQIKVEAIRGNTKIEVIYDAATGAIIRQETSTVRANDDDDAGVYVDDEDGDFIDDDENDDDRDDDGESDDDREDDGESDNDREDDNGSDDRNDDDHDSKSHDDHEDDNEDEDDEDDDKEEDDD